MERDQAGYSSRQMRRILVTLGTTAALAGATAPAARAEMQYGGASVRNGQAGIAISLVLRDDGRIAGRVGFTYGCRRFRIFNVVVQVAGRANGAAFTATGRSRPRGAGTVRFRLDGTLTPAGGTGTIRLFNRCGNTRRSFVVHASPAPAGAPALPARGTLLHGLSAQTAAGVRLPVSIRVATNGRMHASWSAVLDCGNFTVPLRNDTPPTTVRPDGTFSRSEAFTVRYRGGYSERYRVNFSGRFLADGAVGTLRARVQARQRGRRVVRCNAGTHAWTARP